MATRLIAGSIALVAFMIALAMGVAAGNDATTTVGRAIIAMLSCYLVGLGVGMVGQRTVDEHLEHYRRENPIPDRWPRNEPESTASENAASTSQDAPAAPAETEVGERAA